MIPSREIGAGKPKIYVACPTYDGFMHFRMANAVAQCTSKYVFSIHYHCTSLLAYTFNQCLTDALNYRKQGYTHFLMVHADVVLENNFADRMMDIMNTVQCKMLSVVLPIKTQAGLTSTALDSDPWRPSRFTMKELSKLPETFTHPKLLVNTGCLLIDIRGDWVEKIHFTINDRIVWDKKEEKFKAHCQPEDWNISRSAREAGCGDIYATRAIKANHVGPADWPNQGDWGTAETDVAHGATTIHW